MREIFPRSRQLGPAGALPRRIRPSEAGTAASRKLVDELAACYAFPGGLWTRANMVASVDGAISVDGRSAGLSGVADRIVFSVLRSLADVILVGAGTARAEGYGKVRSGEVWPQLRPGRPAAPPIAVVTGKLDLDPAGRLLAGWGTEPGPRTIVLTTAQVPAERREAAARTAEVIIAGEDEVSATAAIDALARLGHRRILVEGGPVLLGQLVAGRLLDELCLTISPVLEGGRAGRITAQPQPGPGLPPPTGLRLATLFEDDGFLLARYLRA